SGQAVEVEAETVGSIVSSGGELDGLAVADGGESTEFGVFQLHAAGRLHGAGVEMEAEGSWTEGFDLQWNQNRLQAEGGQTVDAVFVALLVGHVKVWRGVLEIRDKAGIVAWVELRGSHV